MSKFNVVVSQQQRNVLHHCVHWHCTTPWSTWVGLEWHCTLYYCVLCVMILVFPDHCQHLRCTFRHLDQTLKIMFQKYLSETGNHRTIISLGKSRLINLSSKCILKGIHYQSTFSGIETIQKNRYIFVKIVLR